MATIFIDSLVQSSAAAIVTVGLGSVGVLFWMWIDVRSLKKGMNAAFEKIRELENKV